MPLRLNITVTPGAHELEEVAVGRDDRGVDPLPLRLQRERADRIVGLVAVGDAQHRDAQGLEHLFDQPQLRREVLAASRGVPALYSASLARRFVGLPASKKTAIRSGRSSVSSLITMLVNP